MIDRDSYLTGPGEPLWREQAAAAPAQLEAAGQEKLEAARQDREAYFRARWRI